jgi:hypothetical protein
MVNDAVSIHGVNPDLVQGKARLVRKEELERINTIASSARKLVSQRTLVWDDKGGYRLCPVKAYTELAKEISELQAKFNLEVENFMARHTVLKQQAEENLRDILTEIGFPDYEDMREKFRFALNEMPVASANDIRLNHVSDERVAEIKASVENRIKSQLDIAQHDIMDRLRAVVENISTQMRKEKPRVFDSLLDNVRKTVALVPMMNITANPDIDRIAKLIENDLSEFSTDELRTNPEARKKVSEKTDGLLEELRKFRTN